MTPSDTIFALSSGSLPSGVAIIRVSGAECRDVLTTMAGDVPPPRRAALRTIRDRNGLTLDRGLVVYLPGPGSFTGEDCAELQVHGGRATVKAILDAIGAIPGLRQAEAGEFSRRAFHNGRLDMTAVEGLADLISAQTEMQRRLALEQSEGGLASLYEAWAKRLTFARAMIEAELDFSDEEDVPGSVSETIWTDIAALRIEIAQHIDQAAAGEIIRDGLKVAIVGPPNAGKSSLINYLAGRDVAIVTAVPGTTRDIVSVDLDLGGYAVCLFDTAGLRETDDIVELEGIRRARDAAAKADLVLYLRSPDCGDEPIADDLVWSAPVMKVMTKADLAVSIPADGLAISTVTGFGMPRLMDVMQAHLPKLAGYAALALPSRERHRTGLLHCAAALDEAKVFRSADSDLAAESLRRAAEALGRITGQVDVESLLDVIFSEFCIGK